MKMYSSACLLKLTLFVEELKFNFILKDLLIFIVIYLSFIEIGV